jgi:hypothetical protein
LANQINYSNTITAYRFLAVAVCVHVVYFLLAFYFKNILLVDSFGYLMQADNMQTNGSWYAEDWGATLLPDYFSIRPPLYAWFIIGIQRINSSLFAILLVQNVLSIFNLYQTYKFTQQFDASNKVPQWFWYAAIVCYPAQMIHANFVMTEILFQTFLLQLFIFMYYTFEQPKPTFLCWVVVLLSLCLLLKPVSLLLPFISLAIVIWAIIRHKKNGLLLLLFLVPLATYHLICKQHQHATGHYHYSSIQQINLLKYNARYTLIHAHNETYADSVIAHTMLQANVQPSFYQRLGVMDSAAKHILVTYPISATYVWLKGMAAFFIDPGRFDLFQFTAIEKKQSVGLMHQLQTQGASAIITYLKQAPLVVLAILLMSLVWNILLVVLLCNFLRKAIQYKKYIAYGFIAFLFMAYIAFASGPVGVSRYKVPVYPLLLITATLGFPFNQFNSKKYA